MADTAVICLGNRYVAADALGCRVHDWLTARAVPGEVDVVDGGLCGLDLLRLIENRARVVFVDAVAGSGDPARTLILDREAIAAHAGTYGHGAGLPYLLRMLPALLPPPLPEIVLVGQEGEADAPAVRRIAERSLEIARHGLV
ncbi:MAG: hydrogenase maturation protease [Rhodocyclaceae bacterium]|nr:hydrogenase maturation protease [Rhodocyclaceae bacterium]